MASEFQKLDPGEQWALANGINTYSGARKVYNWKTNDIDNEFSTMSKAERDQLRDFTANKRKEYERIDQNVARDKAAWAAYGGNPLTTPNPDGSDAWKMKPSLRPDGMKNPVMIETLYNDSRSMGDITKPGGRYSPEGGGGIVPLYYDRPIAKPAAPNLSGGQASVPSVQQRMMSRMGQAVQKGVNKGKIKSNQLAKYQVPGQTAPTSPLVNQLGKGPGQLGNPEPNYQFNYPMPNKNLPDANGDAYRGTAGNDQLATREFIRRTPASTEEFVTRPRPAASRDQYASANPVPMPQKRLTEQGLKYMGYK